MGVCMDSMDSMKSSGVLEQSVGRACSASRYHWYKFVYVRTAIPFVKADP